MQHTILYAQWHLHTWFLGCGDSYIQLKHTSSTAKVWGDTDMVETPPAALRTLFPGLSVNICLEWLMDSLLTTEQCQLTDGSVHASWQDCRHFWVKRQPGRADERGITWKYPGPKCAWWIWPIFAKVMAAVLLRFEIFNCLVPLHQQTAIVIKPSIL